MNCFSSGTIVCTGGSQPCISGTPSVKYSVLTFEIDGRIVYLELTPQSGKSNYGKEILFEGIEEFVSFWEQQGYIVSDITDVCTPGANPDFFMDLLK